MNGGVFCGVYHKKYVINKRGEYRIRTLNSVHPEMKIFAQDHVSGEAQRAKTEGMRKKYAQAYR